MACGHKNFSRAGWSDSHQDPLKFEAKKLGMMESESAPDFSRDLGLGLFGWDNGDTVAAAHHIAAW